MLMRHEYRCQIILFVFLCDLSCSSWAHQWILMNRVLVWPWSWLELRVEEWIIFKAIVLRDEPIPKAFSGVRVWLFKHQIRCSIRQITAWPGKRIFFSSCESLLKPLRVRAETFLLSLCVQVNNGFKLGWHRTHSLFDECCWSCSFD